MKLKSIIIFIMLASAFQCARFKVDKLKPSQLFETALSSEGVEYPSQSGVIHEIPARVAAVEDWMIISEPSQKRVKIFKGDKLETVIESSGRQAGPEPKKEEESKTGFKKIRDANLNVPGYPVAGTDEDFFVISYAPIEAKSDDTEKTENSGLYKILHFDLKGKFLHLVGRQARPELSFETLLWVDVDQEGHLWILYRHLDEIFLESHTPDNLATRITEKDCDQLLFNEINDNSLFTSCEYLYPFPDGEKVLFIGRVEKKILNDQNETKSLSFLYRVFKVKELSSGTVQTVFSRLNDPEDLPYIPYDNNHIIIWQTLNSQKFKFALYDLEGDLVNNKQIELAGRRSSWRNSYATLTGNYYSIKVADNKFQVFQWK